MAIYLQEPSTLMTVFMSGKVRNLTQGGGVLIYFSVRGRAAVQGIIFRILTMGQGIIFVKIGSMTGSIFVIFDSERLFYIGHLHSVNVIQIAWIAIFPHFSIDFVQISLQATILSEETKGQGIV